MCVRVCVFVEGCVHARGRSDLGSLPRCCHSAPQLRLSNPRGGVLTNPSSRSWLYALPSSTLSNLKTSASTILPVSIARWLGPQTSSVGEKGLEKGEADKPHFPPPVGSRREDEMALEQWARMESKEPLVLCGHTGSGKISLIRQVFERVGINKVTHIDVHAMLEKKDDMMVSVGGLRVAFARMYL